MALNINSEDAKIMRKMVPLESYPIAAFEELCTNISVEQARDTSIVRRGDRNDDLIYLLTGSVTLQAENLVIETIDAGSDSARFALAHQVPRKIDVVANGLIRYIRLPSAIVNNPPPIEYKEDNSYTIVEVSANESDDWLSVLLRMPLFLDYSPANLQKLMVSVRTHQFAAGDTIVDVGSQVQDFYIITKGQCSVIRPGFNGSIERKLSAGDTFGEDCLIMGLLSREKITAVSEVSLIKLERNQFVALVLMPLIKEIDAEQKRDLIHEGAMLIDVRSKQVAEKNPLTTGVNIPYVNLLNKINDLDKERSVIVYADEKTSQAAAFLLLKHSFKVYKLRDGTASPEPEETVGQSEDVSEKAKAVESGASIKQIIQEHFADALPKILNDQDMQNNGKALKPEAEIKYLKAENERLMLQIRELEGNIIELKIEKQKLAMRTEMLALQLKKLKEFLAKYRVK